jgi:WD40-like Beta Propeller Repeat
MRVRLAALVAPLAVVAATAGPMSTAQAQERPTGPHRHAAAQLRAYLAAARHLPAPRAGMPTTGERPAAIAQPHLAPAVPPTSITGPALVYGQFTYSTAQSSLWERGLQGGSPVQLVAPSDNCLVEPKLSPDGTKVAYLSVATGVNLCDGDTSLVVLDLATATAATIASSVGDTFLDLPNWSPDGSTILFTDAGFDPNTSAITSSQLVTIPAAGGTQKPILGGGAGGYDGVFSPDGTKIAYAADIASATSHDLAIMNADLAGDGVVDITHSALSPDGFSPMYPAWSPDGTLISFQYEKGSFLGGELDGIGVVDAADTAGAGLQVTASVTAGNPISATTSSWSSDGTEIFYDAQNFDLTSGAALTADAVYATNVAGTYRTTVQGDPNSNTSNSYHPFFVGPVPGVGSASSYTPVAPVRLTPARVTLGAGGTTDVQVAGGASPVPANATAVTLNLTGVGSSSPTGTDLRVYPTPVGGSAVPTVSNLNLVPGMTAAVAVQVKVGAGGKVRIRNNSGTTQILLDESGYFAAGTAASLYSSISPTRAWDSGPGGLGQQGVHDVDVAALAAAVTGLTPTAVVLNLTGDKASAATDLRVYPTPADTSVPLVSNLNLPVGGTRANLVTVGIGQGGQVRVFNSTGSVRAIVDVVGFYGTGAAGGLAYYPLDPARVLDTRYGTGTSKGLVAPIGSPASISTPMRGTTTTTAGIVTVPAAAQAFVYNLTAVHPTWSTGTYLTAYPNGIAVPATSTVNAAKGAVVPNLAITGAGTGGLVNTYNAHGATDAIADLAGYYAP